MHTRKSVRYSLRQSSLLSSSTWDEGSQARAALADSFARDTQKSMKSRILYFLPVLLSLLVISQMAIGQTVEWANALINNDVATYMDVAVDPVYGQIVAVGYAEADFDPETFFPDGVNDAAVFSDLSGTSTVGIVSVFDYSGNSVWHMAIGSDNRDDVLMSVAVDEDGSIYLGGMVYKSVRFVRSDGTSQQIDNAGNNSQASPFIAKFKYNGQYEWHHKEGGSGNEIITSLHFDPVSDQLFAAGAYEGGIGLEFNNAEVPARHDNSGASGYFALGFDELGNHTGVAYVTAAASQPQADFSDSFGAFDPLWMRKPAIGAFDGRPYMLMNAAGEPHNGHYDLWTTTHQNGNSAESEEIKTNSDYEQSILLVCWESDFSSVHRYENYDAGDDTSYGFDLASDCNGLYMTGAVSSGASKDVNGVAIPSLSATDRNAFLAHVEPAPGNPDDGFDSDWVKWFPMTGTDMWNTAITGIGTSNFGDIYLTGRCANGTIDFNPAPFIGNVVSSGGDVDGFFVSFSTAGQYQWTDEFQNGNVANCGSAVAGLDNNSFVGVGRFSHTQSNIGVSSSTSHNAFVTAFTEDVNLINAAIDFTALDCCSGQLQGGSVSASQFVFCSGAGSVDFNLTGHTGSIAGWQISENNGPYEDIGLAGNSNPTINIAVNSRVRAILYHPDCGRTFSSSVFITISESSGGTITGPVGYCDGDNITLEVTGVAGDSFVWRRWDGSTWANVTGSAGQTQISVVANAGDQYQVRAFDAVCGNESSPTFVLDNLATVPVAVVDQSTVCLNSEINLSLNPPQAVDHWIFHDEGGGQTVIPNSDDSQGNLTTTVTEPGSYIASLSSPVCGIDESTFIDVSVVPTTPPFLLTLTPTDYCEGQDVIMGSAGLTLSPWIWQVRLDGASTFSDISGTTNNATLTATAQNGDTYRIAATDACGTIYSGELTLSSNQIAVQAQASQSTFCEGTLIDFSLDVPQSTVQWSYSPTGNDADFVGLGAATGTADGAISIEVYNSGYYRAELSGTTSCGSNTSDPIYLEADVGPAMGSFVLATGTPCIGEPIVVTVSSMDADTWYWQQRIDGTFYDVVGSTDQLAITIPAIEDLRVRIVASKDACLDRIVGGQSIATQMWETAVFVSNDQPCLGTSTELSIGLTGTIVHWESSLDNITFSTIAGSNNQDIFEVAAPTATTYYRALIDTPNCGNKFSDTLFVAPAPEVQTGTIIHEEPFICDGESVFAEIEGHSGSILWEVYTPSTTLTDQSGTDVRKSFAPEVGTTVRALIDNGNCQAYTNQIEFLAISESVAPGGEYCELDLWLIAHEGTSADGSAISTGFVESWEDQSPIGGLALVQDPVLAQDIHRPEIISNALNGYSTLHFDGIDDRLVLQDRSIHSYQNGMTIFAVVRGFDNPDPTSNVLIDMAGSTGDGFALYYDESEISADTPTQSVSSPHINGDEYSLIAFNYAYGNQMTVGFNGKANVYQSGFSINPADYLTALNTTYNPVYDNENSNGGPVVIGASSAEVHPDAFFHGEIAEFILLDDAILEEEERQIQSYLALKYGLTLHPDVSGYFNSQGDLIFDIAPANGVNYSQRVVGIGRDDASGFLQSKSTSQIGAGLLELETTESISDNEFVVVGASNAIADGPYFKVESDGGIGIVDLRIDSASLGGYTHLLGSYSDDFTTDSLLYPIQFANSIGEVEVYPGSQLFMKPLPVLSATLVDVSAPSCNGADDATATISVEGGIPDYNAIWFPALNPLETDPLNPTMLVGGTAYSVTISDQLGGSVTINVDVPDKAPLVIINSAVSNSDYCVAGGTGTMNLQVQDAVGTVDVDTFTGPSEEIDYFYSIAGINCSFSGLMPGSYGVVMIDDDGCRAAPFNFTITATPNELTLTCPGDMDVFRDTDCNGEIPLITAGDLNISDACGSVIITQSPEPFTSFVGSENETVTVTVTDEIGTTASCTFLVNFIDPIVTVDPLPNYTLNAGASDCNVFLPNYIDSLVVTPLCLGISNAIQTPPAGTLVSGNTPVEITYTANEIDQSMGFDVTVLDVTPPVFTNCPTDTVELEVTNPCLIVSAFTSFQFSVNATDNCTAINDLSTSANAGLIPPGALNTVYTGTVVKTDDADNSTTCIINYRVIDLTPPELITTGSPESITVDANCTSPTLDFASFIDVSDNCVDVTTIIEYGHETVGVDLLGDHIATVTATDSSGNSSEVTIPYEIVDGTAPEIISCPTSLTLGTDENCNFDWDDHDFYSLVDATDACSGNNLSFGLTTPDWAFGPNDVTVHVSDETGNESTCTFQVTIVDDTPPTIACISELLILDVNSGCNYAVDYDDLLAAIASMEDNCTPYEDLLQNVSFDIAEGDLLIEGTLINVEVSTIDASGISSECIFGLEISPDPNPSWTCENSTYEVPFSSSPDCNYILEDLSSVPGILTYTGSCDPVIQDIPSGTTLTSSTTVTLSGTGNLTGNECIVEVILVDNEPPVLTCNDFVQSSASCSMEIPDLSPTVEDCSPYTVSQTIHYFDSDGNSVSAANPVLNSGIYTVDFEVEDAFGNTNACSAQLTVANSEIPEIIAVSPQTIYVSEDNCLSNENWVVPTIDPACGDLSVTQTSTPAMGSDFALGTHIVDYETTLTNGDQIGAFIELIVEDNIAPVVDCPSEPIIISQDEVACAALVPDMAEVLAGITVSDNCTIEIGFVQDPSIGSPLSLGMNTVVVSYFDDSGNTTICNVVLDVQDTTIPEIDCSGVSTSMVLDYCPTEMPILLDQLVASDCNPAGEFLTQELVGTLDVGAESSNVVIFTATDLDGNMASCQVEIEVLENVLPEITCPDDIVVNADEGLCSTVVEYELVATDNCTPSTPIGFVDFSLASGNTFDVGTHTVEPFAQDASGNQQFCSFTITVNDVELPTFEACNNIITCDPEVSFDISPIDNCGAIAELVDENIYSSGDTFPLGITSLQYTAIDVSGNEATCEMTIDVREELDVDLSVADLDVCQGQTPLPLNEHFELEGLSTEWSGSAVESGSLNLSQPGEFTIFLNAADEFCATEEEIVFRVVALPEIDLLFGEEECGLEASISANVVADQFTWIVPAGITLTNDPSAIENGISASGYGNYEITLSATNENLCTTEASSMCTFFEQPTAPDAGDDQLLEFIFETQVMGSYDGPGSYYWTSETSTAVFENDTSLSTQVKLLEEGENYLYLISTNGPCPTVSDTVMVEVQQFLIPTGFSPNGDDVNETWYIQGLEAFESSQVHIYNRWGDLIYQSDSYDNAWGGEGQNGQALPDDTYYYTITLGGKSEYKGYLILKR